LIFSLFSFSSSRSFLLSDFIISLHYFISDDIDISSMPLFSFLFFSFFLFISFIYIITIINIIFSLLIIFIIYIFYIY